MMRKWLYFLVGLVILGAGYGLYQHEFGSQLYYTEITTKGERIVQKADDGSEVVDYRYKLAAYNKAGVKQVLEFTGNKERPLKRHAYLELKVRGKDRVLSWQAVTKVPEKAAQQLN
ncbi:YxeA family protein [Loigolactobacillus jiayinensis]|uniref:YxeA family protein n=1 Tax=Loigolactobacillus jiayinensis TaxID=2486016 RepID=A0ABW1RK92_9LACO|nr:YxeA family protein [Loigolactobacillus jiayinensis]